MQVNFGHNIITVKPEIPEFHPKFHVVTFPTTSHFKKGSRSGTSSSVARKLTSTTLSLNHRQPTFQFLPKVHFQITGYDV